MRRCLRFAPIHSALADCACGAVAFLFGALSVALPLTMTACSSQPAPASARAEFLHGQLSALAGLETPPAVDETTWRELKRSLAAMLEDELAALRSGPARSASTPPQSDNARPVVTYDGFYDAFFWYLRNPGDYNQDGEVNVSDLTPLGVHLGEAVPAGPGGENSIQAVVDGDGNKLITIADLTPIGANLGTRITASALFSNESLTFYPASNGEANKFENYVHGTVPVSSYSGDKASVRVQYYVNRLAAITGYFWVRALDSDGSIGSPSDAIPVGISTASWKRYSLPTPTMFGQAAPVSLGLGEHEGQPYALLGYYGGDSGLYHVSCFTATTASGDMWDSTENPVLWTYNPTGPIMVEKLFNDRAAFCCAADRNLLYRAADNFPTSWAAESTVQTASGDFIYYDSAMLNSSLAIAFGNPDDNLLYLAHGGDGGGAWPYIYQPWTPGLELRGLGATPLGGGGALALALYEGGAGIDHIYYVYGNAAGISVRDWGFSGGNTEQVDFGGKYTLLDSLVELNNGNPLIVYCDYNLGHIKIAWGHDGAYGSNWTNQGIVYGLPKTNQVVPRALMVGDIAHAFWWDPSTAALMHMRAEDATGAAWLVPEIVANSVAGNVMFSPRDINGAAAVAYVGTNGTFRYAILN